ncbi:hypothetical protein ACH5RR_033623, partial [Cinchona calisaya]
TPFSEEKFQSLHQWGISFRFLPPSLHNCGVLVSGVGSYGLAVETCLPKLCNVAARGAPLHANALDDGLAKREHFVPGVAWNTSCPSLHNCGVLVSVVGSSGLAFETCLPKLCNVATRGSPFHANALADGLAKWEHFVPGVAWNTSCPSLHNCGVLVSVVGSSGLAVETCLPKLCNVAARGSPFHANALADGLAKREHFVPGVAWLGLACCCGWPIGMAMDGLACQNYATSGVNVSRRFGRLGTHRARRCMILACLFQWLAHLGWPWRLACLNYAT